MPGGLNDRDAMRAALEQSELATGQTAPNPPVGAVVVRDGAVIGRGHTQPVGRSHAEVMAIRDCVDSGGDPRGATLVVTLEPCGHHGRTPPCTEAILAAGISRVVVGQVDPTEPMCGRSLAMLQDAGVDVVLGVLGEACRESTLGWRRAVQQGLPEVTVKIATSMDGAIATQAGESQWITGPAARAQGRSLRGTHDAILVGINTVLEDDPRLTTRLQGRTDPVPVVLDTRGRFPVGCALDRPETLVFTGPGGVAAEHSATFLPTPLLEGRVDVERVLRALVLRGHHRLLVEGGGEVIRSLIEARLVDRVEQFIGGRILVGGRPWVAGPPLLSLAEAPGFRLDTVSKVGEDVWLRWLARHRTEEDGCSQG